MSDESAKVDEFEQSRGSASHTLSLKTTPQILELLDRLMPGHTHQESFPVSLLADPSLKLSGLRGLLQGTRVHFPRKVTRPVDEAYRARMRLLRDQLEERSYQSLIVDASRSSLAETRTELRLVKNQISTIVNILISIFTAAMAAWYWTPHWTTGNRVLGALGSAGTLGAIEAFLYLRYVTKVRQSREHEASKRGTSRIIQQQSAENDDTRETKKDR